MDLVKQGNSSLSTLRRKKKSREEKKSVFEAYRSEKTVRDYLFYLKDFLNYVYEGDTPIHRDELVALMSEIETEDVNDYISHLLTERNLKKTSVNKILSSLKSLYRELEKGGLHNPCRHLELFRVGRDLDNILKLSYEDIKLILEKYQVTGDKSYRNTMIIQTLFYTGIRSSELLDLQFKHIMNRDGEFYLKLEKTKSGKEQLKPLHSFLMKKLHKYQDYIKKLYWNGNDEISELYLFPSSFEKNCKMSYRALYSIIQEMGKLVEKDISPHNIRHAIATELSLNGADILEIRDFLGHSNTKVTEVYINAKSVLEKRVLSKIPVPDME